VFRALSLTTRLTLFFTLAAACIVLGLGALFMAASEQHFLELDGTALQDKQHVITDIMGGAYPAEDTRLRLREALNHHHGLFVLVMDTQGNTLFRTAGFQPPPALVATTGAGSQPLSLIHI
jgi:two-component system heavy metal sensor histidine kinase CusS